MADRNFWEFVDDFMGAVIFDPTQENNTNWRVVDTSVAGTPTYVLSTTSSSGELAVDMDTQGEVQNICIYQGDILQYDIDKIKEVEFRIKMNQAALDAADKTQFSFGLTIARNDTIASIAQRVLFTLDAVNSSKTVVDIYTDDASADSGLVTTGVTLINVYKDFLISFAEGTDDVRFFIDGVPVATGTTFDMSNSTGSFQLFMQLQKASDDNDDGFTVDRVSINGVR